MLYAKYETLHLKNFSNALGTSNSERKWKSDALEATKKTLNKPILIVL